MLDRKFVKPTQISKHLFCSFCLEVFRQPTRLNCSHTFCESCITTWIQNNSNCPICRQKTTLKKFGKDLIASKIIEDLEVFCVNDKFCRWKDKLELLPRHMEICEFKDKSVEAWLQDLEKLTNSEEKEKKHEFFEFEDEHLQERLNEEVPKGSLFARLLSKDENSKNLVLAENKKKDDINMKFIDDILGFTENMTQTPTKIADNTDSHEQDEEKKEEIIPHINIENTICSLPIQEKENFDENNFTQEFDQKKRKIIESQLITRLKKIKS